MKERHFTGNFTQQEPIPEEAIQRAVAVLRSGRLHRYNVLKGESSETTLLESEFAAYIGSRYCLACASGGYALHVALRAFGVGSEETILTNAFTLSPVPGAIDNAGGRPLFVESTDNLVIDLIDLESKIRSSNSRLLLLSHMRGHIVDMDALCRILDKHEVALVEDCAHTMGGNWGDTRSGRFGIAACYSTQSYKHMNSGEGGLLISDDADLMARAIIYSGSYMLYDRHASAPGPEVYENIRLDTPNYSGRMDNLRAAILRPQLTRLDANCRRWNERYNAIQLALSGAPGLYLPERPEKEGFVGSSIQFLVDDQTPEQAQQFVDLCKKRGVELKWFGCSQPVGYTSRYTSWHYVEKQRLPKTDQVLDRLFDMRIPLTFSVEDCTTIGTIIVDSLAEVMNRAVTHG